jgi:hypothetical protein
MKKDVLKFHHNVKNFRKYVQVHFYRESNRESCLMFSVQRKFNLKKAS